MSDTIAIGALRELTEHGIHVPDDVRLMGFDGIPFSACTNPPISTVAMDVPAIAWWRRSSRTYGMNGPMTSPMTISSSR